VACSEVQVYWMDELLFGLLVLGRD
jgi:hypothetical protein